MGEASDREIQDKIQSRSIHGFIDRMVDQVQHQADLLPEGVKRSDHQRDLISGIKGKVGARRVWIRDG